MKTVWINGSPKKKMSVSAHLLGIVRLLVGGEAVNEQVRNKTDHNRVLAALKDADQVVFGMPLYVDGLPAHMVSFLQEMEVYCRENQIKLNVYALSNGGFIEGCQSKPLMQIMERFCERSGQNWCGGLGIGGGVMLNVLRIMFFVYTGIFLLNMIMSGLQGGGWLPDGALRNFAEQMGIMLFFHLGVFFYSIRMSVAINRGKSCGTHYTRVLVPSFLFILIADIFFTIISVFQGGFFKGWLAKK